MPQWIRNASRRLAWSKAGRNAVCKSVGSVERVSVSHADRSPISMLATAGNVNPRSCRARASRLRRLPWQATQHVSSCGVRAFASFLIPAMSAAAVVTPVPPHSGQAPNGEVKLNSSGDGSGNTRAQSGQIRLPENCCTDHVKSSTTCPGGLTPTLTLEIGSPSVKTTQLQSPIFMAVEIDSVSRSALTASDFRRSIITVSVAFARADCRLREGGGTAGSDSSSSSRAMRSLKMIRVKPFRNRSARTSG